MRRGAALVPEWGLEPDVALAFVSLQLLLFLKGFTESERNKLAMLTGILLANGNLSASILNSLFNENLVKEGEDVVSPSGSRPARIRGSGCGDSVSSGVCVCVCAQECLQPSRSSCSSRGSTRKTSTRLLSVSAKWAWTTG